MAQESSDSKLSGGSSRPWDNWIPPLLVIGIVVVVLIVGRLLDLTDHKAD